MPTFGSLFAGIGGIDLGLERAGWTGRWQVEWDEYCQRVLAKHWPDIPRYGDITTVDWSGVERVDLIAGGFPCQPFSLAGQRKGKADDRWLWPAFAAAIRALRPRYVLVENVPGLLAGHGGMGSVLGDLAELGYDAEWDSIPAAAVGAPHLRYRVWIIAWDTNGRDEPPDAGVRRGSVADTARGCGGPMVPDPDSDPVRLEPVAVGGRSGPAIFGPDGAFGHVADSDSFGREVERGSGLQLAGAPLGHDAHGRDRPLADADESRLEGRGGSRGEERQGADERTARTGGVQDAAGAGRDAARHANAGEADGGRALGRSARSDWWLTEPDVGRVAHGVPSRVDRLRSLGNAVVPQVVEVIGRRLLELSQSSEGTR